MCNSKKRHEYQGCCIIYITEIPVQMDVLTRYRTYITIWESKEVTKILMIYLLRSIS